MHVSLVHNPGSGEEQPPADRLVDWIRAAGHEVTYQGMGTQVARALAHPGDVVVVAGGDGTVADLALRLVGRGVPLAILPLGTSNNIANAMKVTGRPETLIHQLAALRPRPLDVGLARAAWGRAGFVEAAGLGLFPRMLAQARRPSAGAGTADVWRGVQMLERALATMTPFHCEIVLEGETIAGEFVLVEAMNIDAIGARLVLAPHADPGDGALDVVLVAAADRAAFAAYLARRHAGHLEPVPATLRRRARRVELTWRDADLHLDDQLWPAEGVEGAVGTPGGGSRTVELTVSETPLAILVPPPA
jgi:diacylglycerol kinase family enzyme